LSDQRLSAKEALAIRRAVRALSRTDFDPPAGSKERKRVNDALKKAGLMPLPEPEPQKEVSATLRIK
jgi:hypothetical protein